MANQTSLGLNQWDATDPIKREDFNQDNEVLNEQIKDLQEPPQVIVLPLLPGFVQNSKNLYSKAQNSFINIVFDVQKADGTLFAESYIATLPAGFRPANMTMSVTNGMGISAIVPGLCYIDDQGRIYVSFGTSQVKRAWGQLSFYTAQ